MLTLENLDIRHLDEYYSCLHSVFKGISKNDAKEQIVSNSISNNRYNFAMIDNSHVVGRVTLIDKKDSLFEMHYFVGADFQKQGYATNSIALTLSNPSKEPEDSYLYCFTFSEILKGNSRYDLGFLL